MFDQENHIHIFKMTLVHYLPRKAPAGHRCIEVPPMKICTSRTRFLLVNQAYYFCHEKKGPRRSAPLTIHTDINRFWQKWASHFPRQQIGDCAVFYARPREPIGQRAVCHTPWALILELNLLRTRFGVQHQLPGQRVWIKRDPHS